MHRRGGVAADKVHRSARWSRMRDRGPDCLRASGFTICATQETRCRPRRGGHTGADASDGAREYERCIELSLRLL
jgi:hypothetical protein